MLVPLCASERALPLSLLAIEAAKKGLNWKSSLGLPNRMFSLLDQLLWKMRVFWKPQLTSE
jgi:hypothetical protein